MKKLMIALALCSGVAHAEFKDGNKLLSDMNSEYSSVRGIALGYVMGVSDSYHGLLHCAPPNATAGQMNDMVQNYLTNRPVDRSKTADQIIVHVLKSVWPCESKRGGQSL